jgi:GT2 family glycosyltransferase/glycosyltransferase involved in cell wall biosynthesis
MPRVAVVLVNYKGADDTITCLRAFDDVDWPAERLQLIVVDNASGDGSAERIRSAVLRAVVVESPVNTGFAGGCNAGVAAADADYIGFINNDARPHRDWVRAAVDALSRDRSIAAVASKVLDWDGKSVDFVDGSLTFYGMGYKREVTLPDDPAYDEPRDVLFATGAAMFVRADVFADVGGFDERFFMFYEDVDLGWRLNLFGHRVRYVPTSIAFHKHHASMKKFGQWREDYLLERNALYTMVKNYDDQTLARVLPAALALAVRRGMARGGVDTSVLDLARGAGKEKEDTLPVPKRALAPVFAIDALVSELPELMADRERVQAARRHSDRDLFPLFRQALEPAEGKADYLKGYRAVVDAMGIEEHFATRRRVVVVTGDPLTPKMAGPAIRAWEIAKALSEEHEVELITTQVCEVSHPRFRVRSVNGYRELRKLEEWCDVLVFQGFLLEVYPWLKKSRKVLVVDIYDPFHLEQLEQARDLGERERYAAVINSVNTLNEQLRRADFLMCASDKQRDFWLGQLAALGRVNPLTYDDDETMQSLIAVVPFGLSDTPPVRTRSAIKGEVAGIGPGDKVILWGGGIYNWFDPLTLLRAVDRVRHKRADVRLFFLGLAHPNPDVPEMRMAVATRELSDELGLTGTHVFFNESWVEYDDRANYLLDADIGVSTHLDHVETAFSFRTRILDYFWAGLPVVATRGDALADVIEAETLGVTVASEDVEGLADALLRLLDDDDFAAQCRDNIAGISRRYQWASALQPLVEFCRDPRRAADLVAGLGPEPLLHPMTTGPGQSRRNPIGDFALLRRYLRQGGVREVVRRATGRLARLRTTR